jgi:hypothetical protein
MSGKFVVRPRDDFMIEAKRELIAFERKEHELRRQERRERAEHLQMPALKEVLQS